MLKKKLLVLILLSCGVAGCVSRENYDKLHMLYTNQVKVIYDQEETIKRLTSENLKLKEELKKNRDELENLRKK